MCGRFAIYSSVQSIIEYANILNHLGNIKPNFNAAPSQMLPVIIKKNKGNWLDLFHWGLVPFWANDPKIGNKMINSRAETITQKPTFRNAIKRRRCLIPANGFYEWKKPEKKPYWIHLKKRELFCFAGIWEHWHGSDGTEIYSFSIITTQPNETMIPIHRRMPVILPRENEQLWLNPNTPQEDLLPLLKPSQEEMETYEVSQDVGSPANNYPGLIERSS